MSGRFRSGLSLLSSLSRSSQCANAPSKSNHHFGCRVGADSWPLAPTYVLAPSIGATERQFPAQSNVPSSKVVPPDGPIAGPRMSPAVQDGTPLSPMLTGKGDRRTWRGKLILGTNGVCRPTRKKGLKMRRPFMLPIVPGPLSIHDGILKRVDEAKAGDRLDEEEDEEEDTWEGAEGHAPKAIRPATAQPIKK